MYIRSKRLAESSKNFRKIIILSDRRIIRQRRNVNFKTNGKPDRKMV